MDDDRPNRPPASRAPLRAALLAFSAMGVFWGCWGALIPQVRATLGLDDARLGIALLCVACGAVPAMLAGGRLSAHRGERLLPASVALFALAVSGLMLAHDLPSLAAALLLVGAASGFMDVLMNTWLGTVEARSGTRSMHFAHGLFASVYLLSALVVGAARQMGLSLVTILLATSATMLLLAVLSRRTPSDAPAGDGGAARSESSVPLSSATLLAGLVACIAFLAENGLQSWSALYLERVFEAGPSTGSLAPATVGLSVAIGRLSAQALTRRLSDAVLLVGAIVLATLGTAALVIASSVPLVLLCLFAGGAGISVIAPSVLSIAGRRADERTRGRVIARISVIAYTGFFAGPALLGWLSARLGLAAAFGAIALLLALALPLWLASERVGKRRIRASSE